MQANVKPVPNCKNCKWRYGALVSKCKKCCVASDFVAYEEKEERIDGVYNTVSRK